MWFILLLLVAFRSSSVSSFLTIPRVLDDLSTHRDLHQFTQLLRDSENARRLLRNREVTMFAPTDQAFKAFHGQLTEDLLLYHLIPIGLTVEALSQYTERRQPLQSVDHHLPNLWLSKFSEHGKLFINQAEVLQNDSNHQSRTRDDHYGKYQIVHKISKVLCPFLALKDSQKRLGNSPSGYDLLAQVDNWPLVTYSLNRYYKRVIMTDSVPFFKDSVEGWTFLIPADEFRSSLTDADITQEAIRCSIIPKVVFTHGEELGESLEGSPTMNSSYSTMGKDCHIVFHSGKILESQNLNTGDFKRLKILLWNIPLKNGVAHIVDNMPGIFKPRMLPIFPIRTLWEQIQNDYFLQSQTKIMENLTTAILQNLRNDHPKNLTAFVVWDQDWGKFVNSNGKGLKDLIQHKKLEKFVLRHVSEDVFDTKRLVEVSKTSLRGESVTLGLGDEKIIARFVQDEEGVVIFWGVTKIRILKGDVKCSNGVLHVIDRPFIFDAEMKDEEYNLVKLWKTIASVMY